MHATAAPLVLLVALASTLPAQPTARETPPVLAFPEPGLDDGAAYQGYRTRFFKDAAGNTVQIYVDGRAARVVHLWADADDESLGFTARGPRGRAVTLRWDGDGAAPDRAGRTRTLAYRLAAEAPVVHLGWFLLGSMRVERDFQYERRQQRPFADPPFRLPETERLVAALARLAPAERPRHLALLGARDVATLRARLRPTVSVRSTPGEWVARLVQPSLDGRDTLALEIVADPRRVIAARAGDSLTLRARGGAVVPFAVRIATTGAPLTPLAREEIFTPDFLRFLAESQRAAAGAGEEALRARRMERQVRGVELLVSHEKLMAGLPNYATYFGRDMLVSALMMRPIWRSEMSVFAIAAALRKLSPAGEVSHEEALGGQAVREGASEYAALVDDHLRAAARGERAVADSLLERARRTLAELRRVRENYHMIDDELQLPVLAGRWLADAAVPAVRKRAFLLDSAGGGDTYLARLLRELALVARTTAAYAASPVAANLVAFPPRREGGWSSASWRDSGAGYAGGRFAMDVNAIWAPHALESVGVILDALRALGPDVASRLTSDPSLAAGTPLGDYARDPSSLRRAIETWRGAGRHFVVRLDAAEVRAHVARRLLAMPGPESAFWRGRLAATAADRDSLTFLALALDADGRPIGVANSDPATRLFLGDSEGWAGAPAASVPGEALADARLFVRAYPAGLLVDGVGPVVANDAYAPEPVWRAFERDAYHGPRVVWGREVNLFLLGAASRAAGADPATARELRAAIDRVLGAVEASGFHSELWSHEVRGGRVLPARYGTGSDVQLWSTTDLAVRYALSRLGR
jgi:hypothetical protein